MPHTDLPLEQLREYRPNVPVPADFDSFWTTTLAEARAARSNPVLDEVAGPFTEVSITDLTFSGFGGDPVRAWITRPAGNEPRPAVIEYLGYNGGRGLPGERLQWAAAGFVHVLMDTRGQGSGWGSGGDTADPHGSGPAVAGFMTRGIERPETYFYRRVFTDAVLLTDVVRGFAFVDAERIAVTGGSQGGGISLAVAGLVPQVRAVMPDVPFLCDFVRSVALTPEAPFTEIAQYLSVHRDTDAQVFDTLSYFDGVNFARRATAPALFSAALMDEIVLPSSVFAAFNHYAHDDREIQ
ncbi:MAG: acetylxylan esterase, partial [Pseudolysinimonas sp.]